VNIAITGSSGLVGQALVQALASDGHGILRLRRSREASAASGSAYWDPSQGQVDAAALEGHQVVVHLAGEPLFGVWTESKKQRILRSRVEGTRLLAQTLARLEQRPRLLLTASGIHYYGDRPDADALDESAPAGDLFMSRVVAEWEGAAQPAADAGIRVVHMRMGVVLDPAGGLLSILLPPFRLGLGGVPGSGRQIWSWIALPDVVGAVKRVLDDEALTGAVNTTSPQPVTAGEFCETLARGLHRPLALRVPSALVSLAPGGMGEEMVLASAPGVPRKLLDSGYRFRHPDLDGALRAMIR